MYSRAHLLIERDFDRLKADNIWGLEASPLKSENIFEWTAKVNGLRGTPWEGGVFRLYLKFDEHYNKRPPEVCFHTIPFHPNVDMITGKPCIDILDDPNSWSESYTVSYILLAIQALLSTPVLDNAANQEAVDMILYSPHAYKQMVEDCVAASQRVEAGLNPHSDERVRFIVEKEKAEAKERQKPPRTGSKKAAKISFEDYHATWSGIATSKPKEESKNPLVEAIKDSPTLQAAHYGLPLAELKAQMNKQLEEHSTLVYGKFSGERKPTEDDTKQQKIDQVNKMRKIYLQPRGMTSRKTPIPIDESLVKENLRVKEDEPWEKEVDDLVAWTNGLDEDLVS